MKTLAESRLASDLPELTAEQQAALAVVFDMTGGIHVRLNHLVDLHASTITLTTDAQMLHVLSELDSAQRRRVTVQLRSIANEALGSVKG